MAFAPFKLRPVATQSSTGRQYPLSTALRTSAYQRRTRYTFSDGREALDFTCRSADLAGQKLLLPDNAPAWTRSPFLTWSKVDAAAEAEGPDTIRAWEVVADVPEGLSPGAALDTAIGHLTCSLEGLRVVAEIALHTPINKPPHIHGLVSSRQIASLQNEEGGFDEVVHQVWHRLNDRMRAEMHAWLNRG